MTEECRDFQKRTEKVSDRRKNVLRAFRKQGGSGKRDSFKWKNIYSPGYHFLEAACDTHSSNRQQNSLYKSLCATTAGGDKEKRWGGVSLKKRLIRDFHTEYGAFKRLIPESGQIFRSGLRSGKSFPKVSRCISYFRKHRKRQSRS